MEVLQGSERPEGRGTAMKGLVWWRGKLRDHTAPDLIGEPSMWAENVVEDS